LALAKHLQAGNSHCRSICRLEFFVNANNISWLFPRFEIARSFGKFPILSEPTCRKKLRLVSTFGIWCTPFSGDVMAFVNQNKSIIFNLI